MGRRMQRAAVIERARIGMSGRRDRLPAHRGVAQRGVEARVLVDHRDQAWRGGSQRFRFGDRFLVEREFRSRREEEILDACGGQRGHDRVADLTSR